MSLSDLGTFVKKKISALRSFVDFFLFIPSKKLHQYTENIIKNLFTIPRFLFVPFTILISVEYGVHLFP